MLVRLRRMVRDPEQHAQGVALARGADAKLLTKIFADSRLSEGGEPILGRFFVGRGPEDLLRATFLELLDALAEVPEEDRAKLGVHESLRDPRALHLHQWRQDRWPAALPHLGIQTLHLDRCWLRALPDFVDTLPELLHLHATHGQVEEVSLTRAIRTLVLVHQRLRRVPDVPDALRALDLRDNPIDDVRDVHRFPALREWRLRGATLPELPALAPLAALTHLEVVRSGLQIVPADLGSLERLEHLDLSENLLARLPESLAELRALRRLDMRRNRLTELPRSLADDAAPGRMARLRKVRLAFNELRSVSPLRAFASLRLLDLSNNPLLTLPAGHAWQELRNLDVSHTSLTTLDLDDFPRLEELRVVGTELELRGTPREGLRIHGR